MFFCEENGICNTVSFSLTFKVGNMTDALDWFFI